MRSKEEFVAVKTEVEVRKAKVKRGIPGYGGRFKFGPADSFEGEG